MKQAIAICTVILVSFPALAQEPRYAMQRTEGGVVRLDTQTGAMTLCREDGGNLVCRMAADERAAYEEELDRVQKRVTALEEGFSRTPPGGLPNDRDTEKTLSLIERLMRSVIGIVREFTGDREPGEPQPDRT